VQQLQENLKDEGSRIRGVRFKFKQSVSHRNEDTVALDISDETLMPFRYQSHSIDTFYDKK